MITVGDLRLSLVWTETSTALLANPQPPVPLAFLGRRSTFEANFTAMQEARKHKTGLIPPWRLQPGQKFWTGYLEKREPTTLKGSHAWKYLVPFRLKFAPGLSVDGIPGEGSAEGLFFPHGHALVVRFRINPPAKVSLHEAVSFAHRLRYGGKIISVQGQQPGTGPAPLEAFVNGALAQLRKFARGPSASVGVLTMPLSVVTFVQLNGVDPTATPDEEVQRALEAVTAWRKTWAYDALPKLSDRSINSRRGPAGDVHYAQRRGHAVWYPGPATMSAARLHALACYHHNQTFAALQLESLGELIRTTARAVTEGAKLSDAQDEISRFACGILGRMYAGDLSTYRSWTARAYLTQNDLLDLIDQLRERYNMAPLSRG